MTLTCTDESCCEWCAEGHACPLTAPEKAWEEFKLMKDQIEYGVGLVTDLRAALAAQHKSDAGGTDG